MWIKLSFCLLSSVSLAGCTCAYGGPGCGSPWLVGLCAPVVQVDVPATVEVHYSDDTGLHATDVSVAKISSPTLLGVWPGDTRGSLTVLGLAVGEADVELDIAGWDAPGVVRFLVTGVEPTSTCDTAQSGEPPSYRIPLGAP